MSMYRHAVMGVMAMAIVSCQTPQPTDNFAVEGVAEGLADGDTLYLTAVNDKQLPFDMAVVENGRFRMTGQADAPQVCMVYSPRYDHLQIPLFIEPGNIQVYVSPEGESRVSGTHNNEELQALTDSLELLDANMNELIGNLYESGATRKSHDLASQQARDAAEKLNQYLVHAVEHNIDNELGYYLLVKDDGVLQQEQRLALIQRLPADLRNRDEIQEIEKSLSLTDEQRELPQQITDFTLTRPNETFTTLSEEVGKTPLSVICFWASWSAPFLRETPGLNRLYQRYQDTEFGIIFVSLDTDDVAWKNAIDKYHLPGTHLSELKGWESDMIAAYQIDAIPYYLIVNSSGKILNSCNSCEELVEAIRTIKNP